MVKQSIAELPGCVLGHDELAAMQVSAIDFVAKQMGMNKEAAEAIPGSWWVRLGSVVSYLLVCETGLLVILLVVVNVCFCC